MPFLKRCLINFGHPYFEKQQKTYGKPMFFKGPPFSHRSWFWPKKPSKMTPKIDQNSIKNQSAKIIWKMMQFWSKMTPKWLPKGSQNRPKIDLGATLGPKMGPGCSKTASESQFRRFLIDFGIILDRFLTDFLQNFDRNCIEFGSYFDETKLHPFLDMPVWAKAAHGLAGLARRL